MPANFVSITPENVKWDLEWKTPWGAGSTPLAFLDGDPSTPGIYVVRVNYPPNDVHPTALARGRPSHRSVERHVVHGNGRYLRSVKGGAIASRQLRQASSRWRALGWRERRRSRAAGHWNRPTNNGAGVERRSISRAGKLNGVSQRVSHPSFQPEPDAIQRLKVGLN